MAPDPAFPVMGMGGREPHFFEKVDDVMNRWSSEKSPGCLWWLFAF